MGVKGLWQYLSKHAAGAYVDVGDMRQHAGETWGVEVSLYMHRFGHDASEEAPIAPFLEQADTIRGAGITPVYIFDGAKHPTKRFEHARRRHQTARMIDNSNSRGDFLAKLQLAANAAGAPLPPPPPEPEKVLIELDDGSVIEARGVVPKPLPLHADVAAKVRELAASAEAPPDLKRAMQRAPAVAIAGVGDVEVEVDAHVVVQEIQMRYAREQTLRDKGHNKIPDAYYHALMQAFDQHNIGYYISNGEAEQLGAELVRTRKISTLVTDDGDSLPFGATRILRNLFREGKDGMQFVYLDEVLRLLGLTLDQLVDVCVMSGCDFTESPGIPTIGIVNAVALVKKHGSLCAYLKSSAWAVKLASIQKSAKWAGWKPETFQYEAARSTFARRGLGLIAYESKVINPDAAPMPATRRNGNDLDDDDDDGAEMFVSGVAYDGHAGGKRSRSASASTDASSTTDAGKKLRTADAAGDAASDAAGDAEYDAAVFYC